MAFSKARRLANLMSTASDEIPASRRTLATGSIATAALADDAITSAKIADDAIIAALIADNSVDIARLNVSDGSNGQALTTNGSGTLSFTSVGTADGSITTAKLADDAVTSAKIADDAVTAAKIADSVELGAYKAWAIKTSGYTAVHKDQLIVNSGSSVTITLPSSPSAGNTVTVHAGGAGAVVIGRNGSNINSTADDGSLASGSSTQLVYVDGTIGWKEV